jgi:hypothetical protein
MVPIYQFLIAELESYGDNGNTYPLLQTACTIHMKDSYNDMHLLAKHIQYYKYSLHPILWRLENDCTS